LANPNPNAGDYVVDELGELLLNDEKEYMKNAKVWTMTYAGGKKGKLSKKKKGKYGKKKKKYKYKK